MITTLAVIGLISLVIAALSFRRAFHHARHELHCRHSKKS